MHITGDPDGVPQKVGWAVTDVLTSQQLFGGIMAAILSFERTGGKYKG
jgi:succinate--hydroxymethylglutarate CoA-transferase